MTATLAPNCCIDLFAKDVAFWSVVEPIEERRLPEPEATRSRALGFRVWGLGFRV